ncbi:hypothetical protein GGR54DRAFT_599040 [Hypoxylon sp. NC1633]|nr:hypothetical protein GGR54DRAFT_599040 [Hypoxylon sp. NC1633]
MEPPSKRLRLGQAPYDDDDDEANVDELSMTPSQFDARQDPLYHLDKGRAKAATRLKSAFERIFEKYERDFTGVGDEIDLETGEVIVNNGHLQSLQDENERIREASVLSNEEEGILRGKSIQPTRDSSSKALVRTNPFPQDSPTGLPSGQKQTVSVHGTDHLFASPGMSPNPFGFPNSAMFANPMFANGPVDPLWQTPEIPLPIYLDGFGFTSHAMGYSHPPGLWHAFMPPLRGSYGDGPICSPVRHQAPKRLPSTRQTPSSRALPTEDDSEDDILLGDATQEAGGYADTENKKPSSPAGAAVELMQVDTARVTTPATKPPSKRRSRDRRRSKTGPVSSEPPEKNDGANSSHDENIRTQLTIPPSPPTILLQSTLLLEGESILAQQIAAKLARMKTPIPGSVYARRRRLSSSRKQEEFDEHQTSAKPDDGSNIMENVTIEAPDPLSLIPSLPSRNATSDEFLHEEIERRQQEEREDMQHESTEDFIKGDDKEPIMEVDTATSGQENHEELCVNPGDHTERGEDVIVESEEADSVLDHSTSLLSTAEDSKEPGPLVSVGELNAEETGNLPENIDAFPYNESAPSVSISNGGENFQEPQSVDEDTQPNQKGIELPAPESSVAEDTDTAAHITAVHHDLVIDEIPESLTEVSDEAQQSNVPSDMSQETDLHPPVHTEQDEIDIQLTDSAPRKSQPLEPDTVVSELHHNDTVSLPDTTEGDTTEGIWSVPRSPAEDIPKSAQDSPSMEMSKTSLNTISELALRPRGGSPRPSSEGAQEKSTSPKHHSPTTAKADTNATFPRTPRKRRDSAKEDGHRSSARPSTSTKKKFALASLIPDEEQDELSILSPSVTPNPFYCSKISHSSPAATPRKTSRRYGLVGPSTRTPHRVQKRGAPPATDSKASRGLKRKVSGFASSGVQSSPLARTVVNMNMIGDADHAGTSTPSRRARNRDRGRREAADLTGLAESSPIRTPGGTARRCGEDGFVCERDFCFTCCT